MAGESIEARRYTLGGRVQGVGFRPFVYRLAIRHALTGWVQNRTGEVEIHAQGASAALDAFARALTAEAPPLARPTLRAMRSISAEAHERFAIRESNAEAKPEIHVPPDFFACDDCLRELADPRNRRHRYPFINCTQCGPRYTLITHLPYDRPNTTMAAFPLCPDCRREYENPLDRRFHAEPIACPACGPRLSFHISGDAGEAPGQDALSRCLAALRAGRIVAAKGIGGYHLLCDARSDAAILRLRAMKPRPHKPLAVMCPQRGRDGLDAVRELCALSPVHEQLLCDPARPIVLAPLRDDAALSPHIAPGLAEVGVFLPYSPLHHLLLNEFSGPLVATSANLSGEPVLTDNEEVERRLGRVAEAFLHHDRPIARPADDSVFRIIAGQGRPLRLGRGIAPLELTLPFSLTVPLLAVGGHMKNTVALAWENRLVLSPHIGDLDAPRSLAVFEQVIADLQRLYGVRAANIVHDAHPGYASSRWAKHQSLPAKAVFHHHAHASALAGEHPDVVRWLVFTWDGVGYGAETATGPSMARGPRPGPIGDGSLWGGEALLGQPGAWSRVASFRPLRLPGGEKAAREPWRSAAAMLWETGHEWPDSSPDVTLLRTAWQRGVNAPATSAVGRLFDAAAALIGLNRVSSFEGQAPMLLEAIARAGAEAVSLPLSADANGVLRSDWAPLVAMLRDEARAPAERAGAFHASLAHALRDQARALRAQHGEFCVGLSGGVFQNRLLTETVLSLLQAEGFAVRLGAQVPVNDAGLAFGQVIEAAALPP